MSRTPKLHIPHPPARPGDEPNFDYVHLSPAGAVERPEIASKVREIAHLADDLIRVIDDEYAAQGSWNPNLPSEDLEIALRHIQLTRLFDDHMQRMQRQGKISFYMLSLGEEAISVAQAMALAPSDMLFPSYRTQGLQVARGRSLVELMSQCLSNTNDMCKGRQMPVMYHWKRGNIFSVTGNLTVQYPQAVGWAMAAAIKGDDDLASVWIGDGSTAEADFHHALTFATVYQAPVILNVVNNQWAISTFQGFAGGERRSFANRALGYGIPGLRVDGNDFLAVYGATEWAAERARRGHGPTLIEHVTYRVGAHSSSDDPSRYRPKNEAAAWPLGDPLERLKNHLLTNSQWTEERHQALVDELRDHVKACWEEACTYGTMTEGPFLHRNEMFEDVYKDIPQHLIEQREELRALLDEED